MAGMNKGFAAYLANRKKGAKAPAVKAKKVSKPKKTTLQQRKLNTINVGGKIVKK